MQNRHFSRDSEVNRRDFLHGAVTSAAALALSGRHPFPVTPSKDDVLIQIPLQHDQNVRMLREWIAIPSIAAENIGYPRGAEYMAQLARDAGFQKVDVIPTTGKPGVVATLDVGARNWLGIYFMYDVK